MTTLADIRNQIPTGTSFSVFSDSQAPLGHFVAATRVNDTFTVYLFNGPVGYSEAPLVGRVEAAKIDEVPYTEAEAADRISFRGGSLDGGERVATTDDWRKAFAAIVA